MLFIGVIMGIFGKSKKERINDLMESGKIYAKSFKPDDGDKAILKFSEVLKINPTNQEALLNKAYVLGRQGKIDETIQCFDKAIQIKPDSKIWVEKGDFIKVNSGNIPEVIDAYKKAYELDQNKPLIIERICLYYAQIGQFDKTKQYFNQYLSNNPNDAYAWHTRAVLSELLGCYDEARDSYLKSHSLEPNNFMYRDNYLRIHQEEQLTRDAEKALVLGKYEHIIGKYYCTYIDIIHFEIIIRYKFIPPTINVEQDLRNGKYPAIISILTTDNFFIIEEGVGRIHSIPLRNIVLVKKFEDEYGFENSIHIQYGSGKDDNLYLRIKNDINEFYNSISETIRREKEKDKGLPEKITVIDFSSIKEYLKNGGVVMQTFKCPGCGAALEFPDSVDTTTCQYCGNKIKAVDLFEKIRTLI